MRWSRLTNSVMDLADPAKIRAATTYNAAADHYDAGFWDRYGRRTVARLNLSRGVRVLDVACGSGASALPAAEAAGSDWQVIAVDLAENMLQRARAKASARGLSNIEFRLGDMTTLGYPDRHFDAAFNPWDRITEPEAVAQLFQAAGVSTVDVAAESGRQGLSRPQDWWTIVLGSGLRWTVEQLGPEAAERVKRDNLTWARENAVDAVETNVIYAVATKSAIGGVPMLSGSCLCGDIQYEVAGELGPMGHCHCRTCRKAHAAAFATTAHVNRSYFRWSRGEDLLASFESTPGKRRFFCPRCGSHLIAAWDDAAVVIVRVGSLDSDPGTRPVAHVWTSQKAPWHEITDALPQFPASFPGAAGPTKGQGA